MFKKSTPLAMAFFGTILFSSVQAQVGIGTASPDGSAALQIQSTSKGMLIPKMTQAQRQAISNPANGLMVYQTDGNSGFYFNAGTSASPSWVQVVAGAAPGASGNVLTSNGTAWVSQAPSTGGSPSILSFSTATYSISAANVSNDLYLTYTASVNTDVEMPQASLVPAGKGVFIRTSSGGAFLGIRTKTATSDKFYGYYANDITDIAASGPGRMTFFYAISDGSSGWWVVQMNN